MAGKLSPEAAADKHFLDALSYSMEAQKAAALHQVANALAQKVSAPQPSHWKIPPRTYTPPPEPAVSDFKTAELIMELLSRGYAVIKMPDDGTLPQVFK